MKKLVVLLCFCLRVFGQENTANDTLSKTNPILFSEGYFGFAGSNSGALFLVGVNLNYQFNRTDLLTARYTTLVGGDVSYFLFLPFFKDGESRNEFALLYGKRWIDDGHSWSISAGASFTNTSYYKESEAIHYEASNQNYIGVPFELNVKWFKTRKSRFRAYYGLIPIGNKKVAFGRSVGFKLMGNIGKEYYVGLAFTYGFGFHKKY